MSKIERLAQLHLFFKLSIQVLGREKFQSKTFFLQSHHGSGLAFSMIIYFPFQADFTTLELSEAIAEVYVDTSFIASSLHSLMFFLISPNLRIIFSLRVTNHLLMALL